LFYDREFAFATEDIVQGTLTNISFPLDFSRTKKTNIFIIRCPGVIANFSIESVYADSLMLTLVYLTQSN